MTTATAAPAFPSADAVIAAARPRVQRIHRGTGFYPVTVGGYVVGSVAKVDGRWFALDENGDDIGEARATRADAVAVVAGTEAAAEAYRVAAREGAFGYEERRAALARDEAAAGQIAATCRFTTCARPDCTAVVDLDADPAQDANGEVLCPEHAPTLCRAGTLFAAGWECRTVADGSIMTIHGTRPACARHRALWEALPEVDTAPDAEGAAAEVTAAEQPAVPDLRAWSTRLAELSAGLDLQHATGQAELAGYILDVLPDDETVPTLRALLRWLGGSSHGRRNAGVLALDVARCWHHEQVRVAEQAVRAASGADPFARIPQDESEEF